MLDKVLQMSKSIDDEKAGVSFQMPKSLKIEIDQLCEINGIKLTTFFNSLAQVAIDEYRENQINLPEAMEQAVILEDIVGQFSGGDRDDMIEHYKNKQELSRLQKLISKG